MLCVSLCVFVYVNGVANGKPNILFVRNYLSGMRIIVEWMMMEILIYLNNLCLRAVCVGRDERERVAGMACASYTIDITMFKW